MTFFNEVGAWCKAKDGDAALKPFVTGLKGGLDDLQKATMWLMQNAMAKPDNAGAGSTDYMHLFGLVALGYMWARIAESAIARKNEDASLATTMDAKLIAGKFFMERMMPETVAHLARISTGAETMMAMPAEAF
jgi:hypothetical protein